jgi:hypothetical protein
LSLTGSLDSVGTDVADIFAATLKKLDRFCVPMALANILGQYDYTLTPAALIRAPILIGVISCSSSCNINAAYVHANCDISCGDSLLT